jgi:heat shock protein HslJ
MSRLTTMVPILALLVACTGSGSNDARQEEPREASDPVLRGRYSYLADGRLFRDCATRASYPVATEGDNLALEQAYAEVRRRPGEPVLVEVRGRIEPRPAMEGDQTVPTLVVTEYLAFYPGETCGNPGATADLENTYWKLVRLDGGPVVRLEGEREPHLVLHGREGRLAGSTGCNQLNGRYEVRDDLLALGSLASTKKMCREIADQEARLLAALDAVRTWRIEGVHLELIDGDGTVRARLEATPLP